MWFDVTTTDADQVREFYAALFEWPVAPEADAGPYRGWIIDGEQPWAGVVHAEPATAGRWVPYVVVDDLADATKRAVSLGATVVRDATDGPAGTAVTIADPGGAHLALFKPFA
jgi:predicted enzyme related to lactoylglutathione lyase